MSESTTPDPLPGEGDPVATGTKGQGEWPDKDSPSRGPAPGATGHPRAAEAKADREANVAIDGTAADRLEAADESTAASATLARDDRDALLEED